MLVKTKYFGEIELDEEKVLTFDKGIMGFEDFKKYTILFNNEDEKRPAISWLQSIEEPALAIPVINPLVIKEDYNPTIEDELLKPLGNIDGENVVVLLAMTIPSDLTKMTVNLKAPFVINSDTRRGCQLIVENQDYPVRYNAYDVLQAMKQEKEEN